MPASWPALPRAPADANRLIALHTRRQPQLQAPALSPAALLALPALSEGRRLVAGASAIWATLQRRLSAARAAGRSVYLLFGSFHDSGAQIEVFRRALGPTALQGWSAVTIEQLDADGSWAGVPGPDQRGDDLLIERLLLGADELRDLAELQARQSRQDYTAWKFGFVDEMVDLVLAARALRLPLRGCDMPRALQERLPLDSATRDRLRELHCLLALQGSLARLPAGPRQVAMFWGQDHVKPHGLPRFLAADALCISLYLVGARPGPLTPESELGRQLVVNDLLLVELDGQTQQLALLLPGVPLGGELTRSREWVEAAAVGAARLRVSSELPGELFVLGRRLRVGPRQQDHELPTAPSAAYLLRVGRLRMAGALELAAGSVVELGFDPARRSTRLHFLTPRGD